MNKRVFISGPISGVTDFKKNFSEAAKLIEKMGDTPYNPAVMDLGEDAMPADYLIECLAELLYSDGIYFLPGAEESKGSLIERAFAEYANIPEVSYE